MVIFAFIFLILYLDVCINCLGFCFIIRLPNVVINRTLTDLQIWNQTPELIFGIYFF